MFLVTFVTSDGLRWMFDIPVSNYVVLKAEAKSERLLVYPVGDFDAIIAAPRRSPGWCRAAAFAMFCDRGIVIELRDPDTGGLARSLPIPYNKFDRLMEAPECEITC